jgi:hypothetical protein
MTVVERYGHFVPAKPVPPSTLLVTFVVIPVIAVSNLGKRRRRDPPIAFAENPALAHPVSRVVAAHA